jgi:hypothetical protein
MDLPECFSRAAYCKFSSRIALLVAWIFRSTASSIPAGVGLWENRSPSLTVFAMIIKLAQSIS